MVVVLITQELLPWTQMPRSGKEKLFTMVKSTEKKSIKKTLTISKNTVPNKRMLPMLDSHMLLLFYNWMVSQLFQLLMLRVRMEFHILMVVVLITQELLPWTQMPRSGRELKFTTAKSMEKKNTKKTPTTSKHTVPNKRMLPMPDSHMLQLWSKQMMNHLLLVMPVRLTPHLDKYHLTLNYWV